LREVLRRPKKPASGPDPPRERSADAAHLTPILVDCTGRDGSTLMMRLLATSSEIVAPGGYPYEQKYFAYLWRWSRLLERRDRSDLWTEGDLASLAREGDKPLMGPPLWSFDSVSAAGEAEPSVAPRMFELTWSEFSRRAAGRVRAEHGDPSADVRYYAEKHLDTWLVDLAELPPLKLLILLRDPRDTFVSFQAFDALRRERGGMFLAAHPVPGETKAQRTARFIERERDRLRWIARVGGEQVPVFRYEDLVLDLPGQARRLENWLSVRLDPKPAASDSTLLGLHISASTPRASVGRWKREMAPELAEQFKRELGAELDALGY
jgi:hypothetical protein